MGFEISIWVLSFARLLFTGIFIRSHGCAANNSFVLSILLLKAGDVWFVVAENLYEMGASLQSFPNRFGKDCLVDIFVKLA